MKKLKMIRCILMAVLMVLLFIPLLNIIIDPYGVFGDRFFNWYAFNETASANVAKIAYLEQHKEQYNAFIIGGPMASSIPPDELEQYNGGKYYNLFLNGTDAETFLEYADYAVRQCHAEHLMLCLEIHETNRAAQDSKSISQNHCAVTGENPWLFYSRYAYGNPVASLKKLYCYFKDSYLPRSFDGLIPETGCYDRRILDVQRVGDLKSYSENQKEGFLPETSDMERWAETVESVAAIRKLCDENHVNLSVVLMPLHESLWQGCPMETLTAYKTALAEVTDYWDFSHSSLSFDARYFYDNHGFRNDVGSMMLAKMYDRKDCYIPADFGHYVTRENVHEILEKVNHAVPSLEDVCVPTLMYHHFDDQGDTHTVMSKEKFHHEMELIQKQGFHTVTLQQMLDYVRKGTSLPENPVCITMDDGYRSNYEIAYPVLKEYGFSGTVFAIGVSIGKEIYKDTQFRMTPHFSWDQAQQMQESGVMNVQSHTYDMHQWQPFEQETPCRDCMAPMPGESEKEFIKALQSDMEKVKKIFAENSKAPLIGLAYPKGVYSPLTEVLVHESGIPITFSIETIGKNALVPGLDQSLSVLRRLNMHDGVTDEELLEFLNQR